MDKRGGSSRAETAAANRARLISTARTAFAQQGYAAASMDDLTAEAGLTRGALYHAFGDKKGLLAAVIEEIDAEMSARLTVVRQEAADPWLGLVEEGVCYIEMALDPEVQRIMLLDGPAVLGSPATWPGEQACLEVTIRSMTSLRDAGIIRPVDVEAAARLFNGAALQAALWVAAADQPREVLSRVVTAFRTMAEGLLAER